MIADGGPNDDDFEEVLDESVLGIDDDDDDTTSEPPRDRAWKVADEGDDADVADEVVAAFATARASAERMVDPRDRGWLPAAEPDDELEARLVAPETLLRAAGGERGGPRELRVFDETDHDWIAMLLDLVEQSLGAPWRSLCERVDRAALGVPTADTRAILGALRRVIGGRAERTKIARDLRRRVLGVPALDDEARASRLDQVAAALGLERTDVDALLWADLARERPVTLPRGRPQPLQLAAFANLDRLQHAMRRAQVVRLELRDDANELVRTAARYGLLASARCHGATTVLEVAGPLALFHGTAVYGRALGALVPPLVDHAWLSLEIVEVAREGQVRPRTAFLLPPVLLPPVPTRRRRSVSAGERLARGLLDRGFGVQREPAPLAHGDRLLFPELAVLDHQSGTRWLVELVGFSTDEYLAHKLAAYAAAGAQVLLCVDTERTRQPLVSERVVPFRRTVAVADLERAIARLRRAREVS